MILQYVYYIKIDNAAKDHKLLNLELPITIIEKNKLIIADRIIITCI